LDASAWYHRGNALRTLRRNEEALDSYDRALQIDPRREPAWATRGAVLESLGRYEDALRSYDRALEIDPRDASVWSSRGAALGELGRYHEGISALREALELERTAPRALRLAQLAYVAGATDSAREEAAWVIDNADDAQVDASARFLATWLEIQSDLASSKRLLDETAQRAVADDARPELRPLAARAAVDGSWEALADRLSDWLNAFDHHGGVANLAAAVVDSIARLRAPALRGAPAERWLETWQTVAWDEDEMAPALRMLDSAVRYLESGDRRALLELPQEERLIVEPLVGFRAEQ
jgi:Tfp pilus assembly protein PilF